MPSSRLPLAASPRSDRSCGSRKRPRGLQRELAESAASAPRRGPGIRVPSSHQRRHRSTLGDTGRAGPGPVSYALVGAGGGSRHSFPRWTGLKDLFFRGVVSRDAIWGQTSRANRVEILASGLDEVLSRPEIQFPGGGDPASRARGSGGEVPRRGPGGLRRKTLALTWGETSASSFYARSDRQISWSGSTGALPRRRPPARDPQGPAVASRHQLSPARRLHPSRPLGAGRSRRGRNIGEACRMYDPCDPSRARPQPRSTRPRSARAAGLSPADNFCATIPGYETAASESRLHRPGNPKSGREGGSSAITSKLMTTEASFQSTRRCCGESSEADKGPRPPELKATGECPGRAGGSPISAGFFRRLLVALTVNDLLRDEGRAHVEDALLSVSRRCPFRLTPTWNEAPSRRVHEGQARSAEWEMGHTTDAWGGTGGSRSMA